MYKCVAFNAHSTRIHIAFTRIRSQSLAFTCIHSAFARIHSAFACIRLHSLCIRLHSLCIRLHSLCIRLHSLCIRLHSLYIRLHSLPKSRSIFSFLQCFRYISCKCCYGCMFHDNFANKSVRWGRLLSDLTKHSHCNIFEKCYVLEKKILVFTFLKTINKVIAP